MSFDFLDAGMLNIQLGVPAVPTVLDPDLLAVIWAATASQGPASFEQDAALLDEATASSDLVDFDLNGRKTAAFLDVESWNTVVEPTTDLELVNGVQQSDGGSNWSDDNGNGYYDDGDSIVVTGYAYTVAYSGTSGGGGGGGSLEDDATSITPNDPNEAIPAAEPLATPCVETTFATPNVSLTDVNRAALAASNVIAGLMDGQYEYSSLVFVHNGKVGFTEPYTNRSANEVDWINPEILSHLPDGAVILGVVHSHPNKPGITDSIPSGQNPDDGDDWQSYDQMVGTSINLPRGIVVDTNMLLYIYTNEDHKTRVYDKTDKDQTQPSCPLQ